MGTFLANVRGEDKCDAICEGGQDTPTYGDETCSINQCGQEGEVDTYPVCMDGISVPPLLLTASTISHILDEMSLGYFHSLRSWNGPDNNPMLEEMALLHVRLEDPEFRIEFGRHPNWSWVTMEDVCVAFGVMPSSVDGRIQSLCCSKFPLIPKVDGEDAILSDFWKMT